MITQPSTWRGTLEIEADRLALRDQRGIPHEVQDLFVAVDAVTTPVLRETDVGGGLPPQQTWQYENTTDQQVPGLASLLTYIDQERGPRTYEVHTHRHYDKTDEHWTFLSKKTIAPVRLHTAFVEAAEPGHPGRRGARGKAGRPALLEETCVEQSRILQKAERTVL